MPMTISIDDELKESFSATCKSIGLSPSTAISLFARAVVREQAIPFKISAADSTQARADQEFEERCRAYHEKLVAQLNEAYEQIQQGNYVTKEELYQHMEANFPNP